MQVNIFEVVSRPCTDDTITLPHPTVRTKHKLSSVEKRVERTKNNIEDLLKPLDCGFVVPSQQLFFQVLSSDILEERGEGQQGCLQDLKALI